MSCVDKARKEKNLHLYDVVQTMLKRRILPLQKRAKPMWEFAPADTMTVLSFIHPSLKKMWKGLFKAEERKAFLEEGTDRGLTKEASGDQVRVCLILQSIFYFLKFVR